MYISYNEFHISRQVRDLCQFDQSLYSSSGNVILANLKAVQKFQTKLNELFVSRNEKEKQVSAGNLNAMGLIDEIFHYVCMLFRRDKAPDTFKNLLEDLDTYFGRNETDSLLLQFMEEFPPVAVYQGECSKEDFLARTAFDTGTKRERSNREQVLEELVMLHLANENPAFHPFQILFDDKKLLENPLYIKTWNQIKAYFKTQPVFGPKNNDLINMLKEPVVASPTSLKGQLDYIRQYWADLLGDWLRRLLEGIDTISEEEKAAWHPTNGGDAEMSPYSYDDLMREYERFTPDKDWMPKVILMAKTVLVWLYQLSKKYKRDITRLDQIPDEELDTLHNEGFTGLWLIGLWQRSWASKRIKQINGNPEAASSAYSLFDYEIADNLGGWGALDNLRKRCWIRGIRLAADMVPNHTGMDGKWVIEHPDLFIARRDCPFPQYSFNGENLSQDSRVSIYLEDHYYSKSDCAVCFKRVDNQTGDTVYIYHGNDGTGMPWNDTAQIDFLNPAAREAVIQQIMKVASNFPIIRFDAAMVLAKKHIRRLWYPEPGHGGDIATRSQSALTGEEFENRIPNEFWREVVDRCAKDMPDTLLLAEAFWMMEGYFTRTLGMHRVYNSAFMNMLKKEENEKYRQTVKNTISFDPQILKRYVNFMNNPDEETAVAQFGKGDKYFGVATLMVTMPGLPMFGHGQIEGFEEKYGMEYTRAYRDETPDEGLLHRHWTDIFPLMHRRYLFSGVENFLFYDVWNNGSVNENVFAYSNGAGRERTIVFYNNKYDRAAGWIKQSCPYMVKTGDGENDKKEVTKTLGEGLLLSSGWNHYCIFREHKANLWFVRRSDDIINQGMFVALNGFEYQVYLDVQQVVDSAEGKYAKLHELLDGHGVEDLEVAWEEYRYKDLYAALKNFATPKLLNDLHNLFASDEELAEKKLERPELEALFASVKDAALEYYAKEEVFAKEIAEFPVIDAEGETVKKSSSQKEKRNSKKTVNATAAERWTGFKKQLEFLYSSFTQRESALEEALASGPKGSANAPDILCAFALVSSAGQQALRKWGYSRKLTEYLTDAGLRTDGMKNTFDNIFSLMHIRSLNFGAASYLASVHEAAKFITYGEYSAALTGANEYNGIRWFNKEKMDLTLWYILASVSTFCPRIMRNNIFKLYKTLSSARDSAEYQCAKFVAIVAPVKVKRARSSAKTATAAPKKSPAKKTATKTAAVKKSGKE